MQKSKRCVIQHKKTGIKVVVHPIQKDTISAALLNYILAKKSWLATQVKVKHITNTN